MRKKPIKMYACDFETTTDNPDEVAVWSAEEIEINPEVKSVSANCDHQTTIKEFMNWVKYIVDMNPGNNIILYFHNLKFDGSYILDHLERDPCYHLYSIENERGEAAALIDKVQDDGERYMHSGDYTYLVSSKNVMYNIVLKIGRTMVYFRDSLKLLPFTLAQIGKSFETEHKKLDMEYSGKYPGYVPNAEEMAYIENDVYVLKEGLEKVMQLIGETSGHMPDVPPVTIGSECLREYKDIVNMTGFYTWEELYPSQTEMFCSPLDGGISYDRYCRNAYRGGFCYVKPSIKGVVINSPGYVYDVNSLYPSVMHSALGCFYPTGRGYYNLGDLDECEKKQYERHNLYYYLHVRTEFQIKPDHIPCIQIKGNYLYNPREWLETSNTRNGRNVADLYLTCIDWELIKEHYELKSTKIISHISYVAHTGMFDDYINKWYEIKQKSKGARRNFAKLMLNNCYGKLAQSPDASYEVYRRGDDGVLYGVPVDAEDAKQAKYIPIGAAITSWARNFTIRHAQANYNNFCYADTDSLHMIGKKEDANDIIEHPTKLGAWKNETSWDKAIFAGQKRYIEHVIEEDCEPCDPYDNIKCCGLGKEAKEYLRGMIFSGRYAVNGYVKENFGYSDFKRGLTVPGNLKSRRVKGGIYLVEQDFNFR